MSQQQLLLIVLGIVIIGVAIYIGLLMFASSHASTNKETIVADLQELGTDAYSYIYRPAIMGGGGGTYAHYVISDKGPWGPENDNAVYSITTQTATVISFLATSKVVEGATVTVTYDNFGKIIGGPTAAGF